MEFVQGDDLFLYNLRIADRLVASEELVRVSGKRKKQLLKRKKDGSGKIWAETSKRNNEFQSPPDQIVAVARRDEIHHDMNEIEENQVHASAYTSMPSINS